jgi:hypothetical protein
MNEYWRERMDGYPPSPGYRSEDSSGQFVAGDNNQRVVGSGLQGDFGNYILAAMRCRVRYEMTDFREKKKEYESPRLERIGDVKDLTKGQGGTMPDSASAGSMI